jgi:aromatic-amino-acid transaminase
VFQNVDAYAGDPILSLMEKFKKDTRAHKVNLSIGLYYDERGIIPQMKAVAAAEAQLNSVDQGASVYLPMEGLLPYRTAFSICCSVPSTRCCSRGASPPFRP